ncbi:MAG: hypothetical protein EA365_04460 [Gloeocapsa sp. DLM2.Bin57]|nr:MAG: hypothetical protein EA365_04460 [Gloeocapsa sp. DLM2.Bin57]
MRQGKICRRLSNQLSIKGDDYIFTKDNVEEIVNIQPKGSKAKGYQVRQVRNLIVKYGLGDSDVS